MRALIVALLLTLCIDPTLANDRPRVISEWAQHFSLVVGAKDPRTVLGFFDESAGSGKGYDRAVLDLDGDGIPESVQDFSSAHVFTGGPQGPAATLHVKHDGATFWLTIYGLSDRGPARADYHSSWTVEKDGVAASCMSCRTPLYTTPEAAREGKPIRMGPPVSFDVRPRIEGPKAVLAVTLEGPMGGNLNRAFRDGRAERIRVCVVRRKTVVEDGQLDYG